MLNYSWSEDYSVGDPNLDSHHQTLLDMFNQVSDLMANDVNIPALTKLLTVLKDYTLFHFSEEEEKMRAAAYPGYKVHVSLHQGFIDQIDASTKKITENPAEASEDLFLFLNEWLIKHIQKEDMAYKGKI